MPSLPNPGMAVRTNLVPQFKPVFDQLRSTMGTFLPGIQPQMSRAHQAAATEVRNAMARRLEERVTAREAARGFPRRGSRHLTIALRNPNNSRGYPNANWVFGFQVGLGEWLDSTPARPYWERLEHGEGAMPAFVGRLLRRFDWGLRSFQPPRWGEPGFAGRMNTVVKVRNRIPAYRYMAGPAGEEMARLVAGGGMKRLYRAEGLNV